PAALEHSAAEVDAWIGELDPGDADSIEVALRLLEHETQHHGQLIRYLYAVPLPVPASWVQRYVLEPECGQNLRVQVEGQAGSQDPPVPDPRRRTASIEWRTWHPIPSSICTCTASTRCSTVRPG